MEKTENMSQAEVRDYLARRSFPRAAANEVCTRALNGEPASISMGLGYRWHVTYALEGFSVTVTQE